MHYEVVIYEVPCTTSTLVLIFYQTKKNVLDNVLSYLNNQGENVSSKFEEL